MSLPPDKFAMLPENPDVSGAKRVQRARRYSLREQVTMGLLAVVMSGYVLHLSTVAPYQTSPYPHMSSQPSRVEEIIVTSFEHAPVPRVSEGERVALPMSRRERLAQDEKRAQEAMQLFKTNMARQQALRVLETEMYKRHVGLESAPMDEEATRELMRKAGFKPEVPPASLARARQSLEGVAKGPISEELDTSGDIRFARSIAKEVMKDEVDGFILKVRLLTDVGQYVYRRVTDEADD